MEETQVSI